MGSDRYFPAARIWPALDAGISSKKLLLLDELILSDIYLLVRKLIPGELLGLRIR